MSDEEKALQNDFYPRPPRGGRPWAKRVLTIWGIFLSTPSARRATRQGLLPRSQSGISIHALREEGDVPDCWEVQSDETFLSTPSARRATGLTGAPSNAEQFLSTPSARRATGWA